MATRKMSKKSKRRLVLFGPISLIIIVFFFINLVTFIMHIKSLSDEEKKLQNQLASLELTEKNLHIEIVKLKDPDYIAKFARENYYYSKDGEYVIKLENKDDKVVTDDKEFEYTNYLIYGGGIVLFFVVIFIFGKSKK